MFNWLSKLFTKSFDPRDLATLHQAMSELIAKVAEHETTLQRMERKVYRDIKREAEGNGEKAPVGELENPWAALAAGDQLPPELNI